MTILQNILLPDEKSLRHEELCFHKAGEEILFDGYFNLFSAKKWARYTEVTDAALMLTGTGVYRVTFYDETGVLWTGECGGTDGSGQHTGTEYSHTDMFPLPILPEWRPIWFGFTPLSEDAAFLSGAYVTEQQPLRHVHLAADICTFHREEYVYRNLKVLEEQILGNAAHPLHGLLDVYIIDNGQTLERGLLPENASVHLFPNRNTGGSGGFTRGMLEVLSEKETSGCTHIILLDDDAVLEPDAFVRTYAFLSYLKEEYRISCIGGAMLDQEEPWIQAEAGAVYQGGGITPIGAGTDLCSRMAAVENEKNPRSDYAGWWFACYSLETVREDNLPLPFFLHYDDMEYGLRHAGEVIYLNGICIWHQNPAKRRPASNLYYDVRNRLVTNALRDPERSVVREMIYCISEALYPVMLFRYKPADLVWQAVQDFLAGPEAFAGMDPETKNRQIREMADVFLPLEKIAKNGREKKWLEYYAAASAAGKIPEHMVSDRKYKQSLNGWLLPAKRRERRVRCHNLYSPYVKELYRAKKAVLVDPGVRSGLRIKKSWSGLFHCFWRAAQIGFCMLTGWHKASRAFCREEKYLTGADFWHRYLKG